MIADDHAFDCDVAIVGFGPAGQALASLLGRHGHRVIVVERWDKPYDLPRMSTLDGEIARLMQHVADPKQALARAVAQRSVDMFGMEGQKVATIDWTDDRGGHPSHLSVHQPDIESAMMAQIRRFPSVQVRWGCEAVAVLDDGESVHLSTNTAGAGEVIRARYLVGMDGASSFVREAVGIELDVIHQHEDRWVMSDFDVLGVLPDQLGERYVFNLSFDSPYFYGLNGVDRCRVDARVDPALSDEEIMADTDGGYRLMQERLGVNRSLLTETRRVLYRFRTHMATELRVGRVFIGGDAAHAMTPFLGQGACTAMRDSANLGWKLHLVLAGAVDEALLDTYALERWEHDAQFVYSSFGMWAMTNQTDVESAQARDDFMRAQDGDLGMFVEPIADGILHRDPVTGQVDALAGELSPQAVVQHGAERALLDDIVGHGFQLLIRDQQCARSWDREPVQDRLSELGVHVVVFGDEPAQYDDVTGAYLRFFTEAQAVAVLARPDFYVFGTAPSPQDIGPLVDDLLSQLPHQSTEPGAAHVRHEPSHRTT